MEDEERTDPGSLTFGVEDTLPDAKRPDRTSSPGGADDDRRTSSRPPSSAPPSAVRAQVFGLSDVGCTRTHNEDSFLVAELERSMRVHSSSRSEQEGRRLRGPPQGYLLMVADGMGGHAAGEVASAMTIDALSTYAFSLMPWTLPRGAEDSRALASELRRAVRDTQDRLRALSREHEDTRGMGTTLTMAYVVWPDLYAVHVGDTRMYAFRNGGLHQVTTDHTLAQQLVEHNVLSSDQAEESDFSNVLVNALGGESDDLRIELHHARLFPGDILLLCSDGLTKHVSREELEMELTAVADDGPVEAAAGRLIARARDDGGTDNITVVLARF